MAFDPIILLSLQAQKESSFDASFTSAANTIKSFKAEVEGLKFKTPDGAKEFATTFRNLGAGISSLAKSASQMENITKGVKNVGEALDKLAKVQVTGNVKELAAVIGRLGRGIRDLDAAGESAGAELEKLGQSVQRFDTNTKEAVPTLRATSQTLQQLGTASKRAADDLNDTGRAAGNASGKLSSIKFQGAIDGFINLGLAQARFLASGIVLFGIVNKVGEALSRITETSTAVARVMTVASSETLNFAQQQTALRDALVATSNEVGTSIQQTSEALFELGSAGLSVEESIAALNPVLNLAVGTTADMGETAKTVAGIFEVFGKNLGDAQTDTEKFEKITNTLGQAFKISLVETQDLVSGLKFLGGTADTMGLKFEEATGILTVLNDNLIKGGQAGRAARGVFADLTGKSEELAAILGVTFQPGQFESFINILRKAKAEIESTDAVSRRVAQGEFFRIFGAERAPAFITLARNVDNLKEDIRQLGPAAEDAARKMKEIQVESLSGQLAVLNQNVLNLISGSLGPFAETLRIILVDGINPILNVFNSMNEATGGLAGALAVGSAAVLAFGNTLSALSESSFGAFLVELPVLGKGFYELAITSAITGEKLTGLAAIQAFYGASLDALILKMVAARVAFNAMLPLPIAVAAALVGVSAAAISVAKGYDLLGKKTEDVTDNELAHVDAINAKLSAQIAEQNAAANINKALDEQSKAQARLIDAYITGNQEIIDASNKQIDASNKQIDSDLRLLKSHDVISESVQRSSEGFDEYAKELVETTKETLRTTQATEDLGKALSISSGDRNIRQLASEFAAARKEVLSTSSELRDLREEAAVFAAKGLEIPLDLQGKIVDTTNDLINLQNVSVETRTKLQDALRADPAALERQASALSKLGITENQLASFRNLAGILQAQEDQLAANRIATEAYAQANEALRQGTDALAKSSDDYSNTLIKVNLALSLASGKTGADERVRLEIEANKAIINSDIETSNRRLALLDEQVERNEAAIKEISEAELRDDGRNREVLIASRLALETKNATITAQANTERVKNNELTLNQLIKNLDFEGQKRAEADAKAAESNRQLNDTIRKNDNELRNFRRSQLDDAEKLAQLERDIRRQVAEVRFDPGDIAGSVEKSNAALREAQSLLSQLPTSAVKNGEEIIATEEDLAATRENLMRKIAAASEDLARGQALDAENAATRAKEAQEGTQEKIDELIEKSRKGFVDLSTSVVDLSTKIGIDLTAAIDPAKDKLDSAFGETGQEQLDAYTAMVDALIDKFNLLADTGLPNVPGSGNGGPGAFLGTKVPGFGGGDRHHYMLEGGEGVINKWATRVLETNFGPDIIDRINRFAVPENLFGGKDKESEGGGDTFVFAPQFTADDLRGAAGMTNEEIDRVIEKIGSRYEQWMYRKKGRRM